MEENTRADLEKLEIQKKLLKPLEYFHWLAIVMGLQQDGNQSWWYFIYGHLLHILCFDSFLLCEISYLFMAEKWQEMVVALSLALTVFFLMLYLPVYFKRVNAIGNIREKLIETLKFSVDERFEDRGKVYRKVQLAEKIYKIYIVMFNFNTFLGFMLTVLTKNLAWKEVNYPFDTETGTIGFVVAAAHELLACSYGSYLLMFMELFPVTFMIYATGLLDELAERVSLIGTSKNLDHDELGKCIEVHKMIKELVFVVQENFGLIFFMMDIVSTIIIGLSVFSVSSVDDKNTLIMQVMYFGIMSTRVFIPCYFGHELMISSENVLYAAANCNWFDCEIKTRKSLIMLMGNLTKPLKFHFHGLLDLNLYTFTNIMQSAYSLLAVLRRVNM